MLQTALPFLFYRSTGTGSAATLPASIYQLRQSTLPDGRVIVTGGGQFVSGWTFLNTVYIYTPSDNTWSEVASLPRNSWGHGQSTLLDGRVLVSGGTDGNYTNASFIYTQNSNTWNEADNMPKRTDVHGQSTLNDGRVLISGGYVESGSVYIYAPGGTWGSAANLLVGLSRHGQSTLHNGNVLVSGGGGNSAYIYTPDSMGAGAWISTASLSVSISGHGQSTLADGSILVSGGNQSGCYIYTTNGTWTNAARFPENTSWHHSQSTLADGRVLVTGGATALDGGIALNTTYIYTPAGWSYKILKRKQETLNFYYFFV